MPCTSPQYSAVWFVVSAALYAMLETHSTQAASVAMLSRTITDPDPPGPGFPQDPPSKNSRNVIPGHRQMGNTCIAGGSSKQRIMSTKADLTCVNRPPSLFMSGWYTDPINRVIARGNCVLALAMCVSSVKDGSSIRRSRSNQIA